MRHVGDPGRSSVDVIDDRIPAGGVEVEWCVEDSVQVGLAVGRFHDEFFRWAPAERLEAADVGCGQSPHQATVGMAQVDLWGSLRGRMAVEKEPFRG